MEQRLIDANSLHYRMGANQDDKQIFYVTGEDIYAAPTIDPESLWLKTHWIYVGRTDEDGNLVCWCSRCEHGDRHSPKVAPLAGSVDRNNDTWSKIHKQGLEAIERKCKE